MKITKLIIDKSEDLLKVHIYYNKIKITFYWLRKKKIIFVEIIQQSIYIIIKILGLVGKRRRQMLRINDIKIEVTEPQFSTIINYKLHLLVSHTRTITKNAASVSNQSTLIWKEDIPLKYGQNNLYQFEVVIDSDQHPSMQPILRGKFYIEKNKQSQSNLSCDVYNVEEEEQKMGTLTATVSAKAQAIMDKLLRSKKNQSVNSQIPLHSIPKILRILSLIAKINYSSNNSQTRRLYFHIEIGNQVIKTSVINCRGAEVVFIQPRQVQIPGELFDKTMMQIKVCNQDKGTVLGQAWMELSEWKPAKRLALTKNTFQIGQLYIESRLANKNLITTTNHTQNPHKTISPKPVNQLQQGSAYRTLNPVTSTTPISQSIDLSYILQQRAHLLPRRSSSRLESSMVSTLSSRRKSSVINDNGSRIFSKEKRFSNYEDKQNQKITYLNGVQRSFQFKKAGVGGRYRGASIGYGNKADFVSGRNYPGVGDYKLPSIWDKY